MAFWAQFLSMFDHLQLCTCWRNSAMLLQLSSTIPGLIKTCIFNRIKHTSYSQIGAIQNGHFRENHCSTPGMGLDEICCLVYIFILQYNYKKNYKDIRIKLFRYQITYPTIRPDKTDNALYIAPKCCAFLFSVIQMCGKVIDMKDVVIRHKIQACNPVSANISISILFQLIYHLTTCGLLCFCLPIDEHQAQPWVGL